jgi:hypothetical protein
MSYIYPPHIEFTRFPDGAESTLVEADEENATSDNQPFFATQGCLFGKKQEPEPEQQQALVQQAPPAKLNSLCAKTAHKSSLSYTDED